MFEVRATDLAGRIGVLRTKSGKSGTPALLPVIHPARQVVSPAELKEAGFHAVMTNAYLTMKHFGKLAEERGIHHVIGFDGVVMTDSGGYQVLEYGEVEATPREIASFQEAIGSDIAVALDRPTGLNTNRDYARLTVDKTLRAAKETLQVRKRKDILWAGPVQGGGHLDLLGRSARRISEMDFDLYALGSPTEVMEEYNFTLLTQMIRTAKRHLPLGKPLHLFGAGHPLTIPLAVALGCDLFDSASYVLFARARRYMTPHGTSRLEQLSLLPCSCRVCSSTTVKELMALEESEATRMLATHNLFALAREVRMVKQAIREGRLWEYLGGKARSHPKLWEAFRLLRNCVDLEDGTPLFKPKALFLFSPPDHGRPEVVRARRQILKDTMMPRDRDILIVLPEEEVRPFYTSPSYLAAMRSLGERASRVQVCYAAVPFGLIPVEVSDIYPFSQCLTASSLRQDPESRRAAVEQAMKLIARHRFKRVLVVDSKKECSPTLRSIGRSTLGCRVLKIKGALGSEELHSFIAKEVEEAPSRSKGAAIFR